MSSMSYGGILPISAIESREHGSSHIGLFSHWLSITSMRCDNCSHIGIEFHVLFSELFSLFTSSILSFNSTKGY